MLDREQDLPTEWYATDPDAHAIAPDLTRAIWNALRWEDPDRNGRLSTKVYHEPPSSTPIMRGAGRWLSVVLDADHTIHTVRAMPDLSQARAVVGLHARPSMPLWTLNAGPKLTCDAVLDATERRLRRRYERGLTVVQIGDAAQPRSGDTALDWTNDDRIREILSRLRDHYGDGFKTALATIQTEAHFRTLMEDAGIDLPDGFDTASDHTLHYGEEKSRNDFADERAGTSTAVWTPATGWFSTRSPSWMPTPPIRDRRATTADFVTRLGTT
ncbi:hypothetical protein [Halorubrum sp. BOL3-1]|uniref:hypothetical protein n=1 Tax=Halorubrum sp. BOL3-1 TaxID=2497325 RepID=UPI00140B9078|nr:hypothetical protein [Halorubrum sp. BOL3-1]